MTANAIAILSVAHLAFGAVDQSFTYAPSLKLGDKDTYVYHEETRTPLRVTIDLTLSQEVTKLEGDGSGELTVTMKRMAINANGKLKIVPANKLMPQSVRFSSDGSASDPSQQNPVGSILASLAFLRREMTVGVQFPFDQTNRDKSELKGTAVLAGIHRGVAQITVSADGTGATGASEGHIEAVYDISVDNSKLLKAEVKTSIADRKDVTSTITLERKG